MAKLPAKQDENPYDALKFDQYRLFVDEYCTGTRTGKRFNKTKAAEAAGYQNPSDYGYRLYLRDDIRAAISYMLEKGQMSKHEVVERIRRISEAEMGEILKIDFETGVTTIDPYKLELMKPFLKSYSIDSNGNPKFEFHDSFVALQQLARIYGLNKDGLEIGGPGGGAVPVEMKITFVNPPENPDENPLGENPIPEADWEELTDGESDENPD